MAARYAAAEAGTRAAVPWRAEKSETGNEDGVGGVREEEATIQLVVVLAVEVGAAEWWRRLRRTDDSETRSRRKGQHSKGSSNPA